MAAPESQVLETNPDNGTKTSPIRKLANSFLSLSLFTKIQIIALLIVVLVIVPFVVANRQIFNPQAEAPQEEVVGTMEVNIAEDLDQEKTSYSYSIKQDDGKSVKIKNISKDNAVKNAGNRVRIKGKKVRVPKEVLGDSTASADVTSPTPTPQLQEASLSDPSVALEVSTLEVISSPPPAPIQKRVAVLLINFSNDPRTLTYADHTNVTPTAARGTLFTNAVSVKSFLEEQSRGTIQLSGDVFGYYTIPSANSTCSPSTFQSQARSAAAAAGVDLSGYTNVVVAWPILSSCGFAGSAYVRGSVSYNNDAFTLRILSHELEHNFGVLHASSLNCLNGSARVPISTSCTYAEYGDPFDIMGSSTTNHTHSEFLGELGWLQPNEVQTITSSGTYTIRPLITSPSGNTKLLKIPRGNGTNLYLDFRATYGSTYDKFPSTSPAVNGVTVRTSGEDAVVGGSLYNSMLIDTTPSTTTFQDAPLLLNQSLYDPIGRITVTTLSVSPGVSATVKVEMASTATPTPTVTNTSPLPTNFPTSTPTPTPRPTSTPTPTPRPTSTPTPTPVPLSGNITFVKTLGAAYISKSGNSQMTIPVGGSVSVGHRVIVSATISTFGGTVTCRDNRGNLYTVDARTSTNNLVICSGRITTPLQIGDTITITYPSFSGVSSALANDFTGISSVKKFSQGASTSTKNITVGSSITTTSNILLFGAVGSTYPVMPSAGFASLGSLGTLSSEYRIVNSGSHNSLGTVTAGSWRSLLVGYQ